jgi:hypothetical protein
VHSVWVPARLCVASGEHHTVGRAVWKRLLPGPELYATKGRSIRVAGHHLQVLGVA